jgi:hypothetical protein
VKEERRAFGGLRLNPDLAAVAFDDPFANGETDAGARILVAAVQPLERITKDAFDRSAGRGRVMAPPSQDVRELQDVLPRGREL